MKGIKMKKILKYSTIIGTAIMLTGSAVADTGGYVRVKGFDSHFNFSVNEFIASSLIKFLSL